MRILRVKHAARKLLPCAPKRGSMSMPGVDFDFTYASIVNGSAKVARGCDIGSRPDLPARCPMCWSPGSHDPSQRSAQILVGTKLAKRVRSTVLRTHSSARGRYQQRAETAEQFRVQYRHATHQTQGRVWIRRSVQHSSPLCDRRRSCITLVEKLRIACQCTNVWVL